MKKILLLSLTLLFISSDALLAQNIPQGFNYQCIVRDDANNPVIGNVDLTFTIHANSPDGPVEYSQLNTITTNDFGLVNLVIGEGLGFDAVDWGSSSKFLKVTYNGETIGSSQLVSVPYALYAEKALESENDSWGNQVAIVDGVTIIGDGNITPLSIAPGAIPPSQTLSIDENTLSISDGNDIVLPVNGDDWGNQNVNVDGTTIQGNGDDMPLSINPVALPNPQTLSIDGNNLSISGGNEIVIPTNSDNWGSQVAVVDEVTIEGSGITQSPLTVKPNSINSSHIEDGSISLEDFGNLGATLNGQIIVWDSLNNVWTSALPGDGDGNITITSPSPWGLSTCNLNDVVINDPLTRVGIGGCPDNDTRFFINSQGAQNALKINSLSGQRGIDINAERRGMRINSGSGAGAIGLEIETNGGSTNSDGIILKSSVSSGFANGITMDVNSINSGFLNGIVMDVNNVFGGYANGITMNVDGQQYANGFIVDAIANDTVRGGQINVSQANISNGLEIKSESNNIASGLIIDSQSGFNANGVKIQASGLFARGIELITEGSQVSKGIHLETSGGITNIGAEVTSTGGTDNTAMELNSNEGIINKGLVLNSTNGEVTTTGLELNTISDNQANGIILNASAIDSVSGMKIKTENALLSKGLKIEASSSNNSFDSKSTGLEIIAKEASSVNGINISTEGSNQSQGMGLNIKGYSTQGIGITSTSSQFSDGITIDLSGSASNKGLEINTNGGSAGNDGIILRQQNGLYGRGIFMDVQAFGPARGGELIITGPSATGFDIKTTGNISRGLLIHAKNEGSNSNFLALGLESIAEGNSETNEVTGGRFIAKNAQRNFAITATAGGDILEYSPDYSGNISINSYAFNTDSIDYGIYASVENKEYDFDNNQYDFAGFFDGNMRVNGILQISDLDNLTKWNINTIGFGFNEPSNCPGLSYGPGDLIFQRNGDLKAMIDGISGEFCTISDKSLKENILNLSNILPKINQLRPVSYNFISDASKGKSTGFIAQEVDEIFPELVHRMARPEKDDLLTLNYDGFSVLAIQAIQEQQEVIDQQQVQLNNQQAKLDALEKEMAIIRAWMGAQSAEASRN